MIINRYDKVIRPIVTEKTNIQKEKSNQVSFEVLKGLNRIEITKAIESIFNVNVIKTRTICIKGKVKRKGRIVGKRRDWKKAIVTLMPGQSINFFEGA